MSSIMRRRRGLKSAISILLSEGAGSNTHILSARRRSTPPRHPRRDSGFVQSQMSHSFGPLVLANKKSPEYIIAMVDQSPAQRRSDRTSRPASRYESAPGESSH